MRAPRSASTRGAALLLVLGILVLVCALVLSFFSSVNTELSASQSYANGATVKQLSDSAVQVAISQVVAGTQGTANGGTLAWASQPGMIRTWDAAGSPGKFYKLYSERRMVVDGTGFDPAAEVPPNDWDAAANAGLFTDLNAPVTRDGTVYFPIVDPRAQGATAAASVEGFSYQGGLDGVVLSGGDAQRLPMPVRWLYVLQNGRLAVPTGSAGGKVSFDTTDPAAVPSASNPIAGRIAFWTDDETCKLNVNTASEGTFWDRPWMNTLTEQGFSTAIPGQNEYQRFPGHPATTCLSPVFGPILPSSVLAGTQIPAQLKAYYDLSPRIADGGTQGGTVGNTAAGFAAVTLDGDRLYASPDEMLYAPARSQNSPLTNAFLEKAKFFLTAHSRAPETNLFGLPRVALWPLMASASLRNAKDKLIAFCATIGGKAYYVQRQAAYTGPGTGSSQSATADWTGVARNQDLYNYLVGLGGRNVPGFGGKFSGKYPKWEQVVTEMIDMVRGGVNTYSTALTPSYNYAPQLGDPGEGQVIPLHLPNGTQGFGRYATVTGATLVFFRGNAATFASTVDGSGHTVVTTPVQITPAATQIRCALILNPYTPSPGMPTWSPSLQYVVTGMETFKISSSAGTTGLGFPPSMTNTTTGRVGFSGGGNAMPFFGLQAAFRYATDSGLGISGKDGTKTEGSDPRVNYPFVSPLSPAAMTGSGDATFDFIGNPITVTIYAAGDTGHSTPLQVITLPFAGVTGLPVPTTDPRAGATACQYFARFAETAGNTISKAYRTRLIANTTVTLGNDASGNPVNYTYQDVARGVEPDPNAPAKGDLRVYAALSSVPATYFRHSPGYDGINPKTGQKYQFSQSLRDEGYLTGGPQFGYDDQAGGPDPHRDYTPDGSDNRTNLLTFIQTNSGYLVEKKYLAAYGGSATTGVPGQQEYRGAASPAVPRYVSGDPQGAFDSLGDPGDWDNMTGITEDGPYINKPDEGNGDTVSALSGASYINKTLSGGYFSYGLDLQNLGGDYRAETSGKTFSPNRQVASAVMFGSLPTGIDPNNAASVKPWQTLLFCANPAAGANHPGFGVPASGPPYTTPPDSLLLDLFTMPVVEPYAISEPLSTAGKVNMNYPIVPFSYITRDTAVRGVLKAVRLLAIPTAASTTTASAPSYKDGSNNGYPYECRYNLNLAEAGGTLEGFERRFTPSKFGLAGSPDLFRSAAEICGISLVPQKIAGATYPPGVTEPAYSAVASWWTTGGSAGTGFRLTGDNAREIPYGDIYPRLTTRSNTYTVHFRVQTLKKVSSTAAAQWVEGTDLMTGEYRGSVLFERYVDASDTTLPDFAAGAAKTVDDYYKVRIVSAKKFSP